MASVTVVVPAFEAEEVLPRCLESLLAQTLEDLEILVVDDGSADGTGRIAESFAEKDGRIRPIRLETNRGTFAARNAGIRYAAAPYLGFLDADDRASPEMFLRLLDTASASDADIVVGNFTRVLPDGERRPTRLRGPETLTEGIYDRFVGLGFGGGFLGNKLYRRELLADHPVVARDDRITRNEDYLLNLAAFAAARVVRIIPDSVYDQIVTVGSTTADDEPAAAFVEILDAYRRALDVFDGESEEMKRGIDTLYATQLGFDDYRVEDPADFAPHAERIAATLAALAKLRPAFLSRLLRHRPPAATGPRWRRALGRLLGRGSR